MTGPRLANRTEEIVIHALGHLLNGSEASREALQNFLLTLGTDVGRISRVSTQYTGRRPGGKPDLVGQDSAGEERLLIEAKFDAPLTLNQPVEYLRRLKPEQPSVLLFVATPDRLNSLWEELRQRVEAEKCLGDLENEHKEPEILRGNVGENRNLILTSWRFLLDNIATQASSVAAQTVNDVHQLQGLVERRSFEPLRQGALPPEFPRSLPHLYLLIDDAVHCLVGKSLASLSGYRPTSERDYSVRYFTLGKMVNSSLGLYFDDWRSYHHSPLRFAVRKTGVDDVVAKRLTEAPLHGWQDQFSVYIPILLWGHEYQTVLNSIVKQIERIAAVIEPNPD